MLSFAFGLLVVALLITAAVSPGQGGRGLLLAFANAFLGYFLYWIVLAAFGRLRRFTRTVSCIMACGSILTVIMVAAAVLLGPLLGGTAASIVAYLILFWSVPVKGHIIAQAIERHWYFGNAIALTIFIMQYFSILAMTGRVDA